MPKPSREADYRACAERGLTMAEAARSLRVSRACISWAAKQYGIEFRGVYKVSAYAGAADRGLTRSETAREMGVSVQAVSMAANRHGLTFARKPPKDRRPGGIFASMTPSERADYRTYRENKFTRAEALASIGRADLIA